MAEEITIVEVFREIFIKITLEEAVSRVVDLIINIIYYYYFFNKRSIIYIKNLRNTKIEIQPILSYRGSFPSHLVRTVKLKVRILSITDAAALYRG